MKKKDIDQIFSEINETTIPNELLIVFMTANALQLMVNDSFRRIENLYRNYDVKMPSNSILQGLSHYSKLVIKSSSEFFNSVEPMISTATFDAHYDREKPETADHAAKVYDSFGQFSNELCRLILLYLDRTLRNNENYSKVFKTLRQLPSGNLINDEDITRFKQK